MFLPFSLVDSQSLLCLNIAVPFYCFSKPFNPPAPVSNVFLWRASVELFCALCVLLPHEIYPLCSIDSLWAHPNLISLYYRSLHLLPVRTSPGPSHLGVATKPSANTLRNMIWKSLPITFLSPVWICISVMTATLERQVPNHNLKVEEYDVEEWISVC